MSKTIASDPKCLFGQSQEGLSLEEALQKVAADLLAGAIGLFYSPENFYFGKLSGNGSVTVCTKNKQGWHEHLLDDLSSVFEARVFNEQAELRWLNLPGRGGKAVLLSDTEPNSSYFDTALENLHYRTARSQTYLLWGETAKTPQSVPEGWSLLATARIGTFAVPIAPENGKDYILLHSREYLGVTDQHGNVVVQEERLVKLTWETKKKGRTDGKQ